MKFSSQIVTVAAICQSVSAFTVEPSKTFKTQLNQGVKEYSYNGNAYDTKTSSPVSNTVDSQLNKDMVKTPSSTGMPRSSINRNIGRQQGNFASSQRATNEIFDEINTVTVQGGSLRTCSFHETVGRVSVYLKTEGRPLNANVELWQGPDNSPQKMSVYLEDGSLRPFRCIVESPGSSNSVAIRNTGQMEFPLTAGLEVDMSGGEGDAAIIAASRDLRTVQGGAVYTTPFPPNVASVAIMLKSDGRPLNARVELLQGPNNNKQVMEVYTEDGMERPFFCIVDTPGTGNVVRIVNTATVEFPLTASVEPFMDKNIMEDTSAAGGMTWS